MRERVRQREVIAGEYKRVQAYPVRATSSRRGAKRGPTSEAQERMNAENARRLTPGLSEQMPFDSGSGSIGMT